MGSRVMMVVVTINPATVLARQVGRDGRAGPINPRVTVARFLSCVTKAKSESPGLLGPQTQLLCFRAHVNVFCL